MSVIEITNRDDLRVGDVATFAVEDDDGVVLATYDAPGAETREQPHVSDPADEDRPFYS